MALFALEIGNEEIPAKFLQQEEQDLKKAFEEKLNENDLEFSDITVLTTPRRAVVIINNLPTTQPEKEIIISGPPVKIAYDADNNPTKALEGFLKTNEIDKSNIFISETEKGKYVSVKKKIGGQLTADILQNICPQIISNLSFPKRMRWGDATISFARPIRWILALLDDKIISFNFGHISSDNKTYGHRIHGLGPFTVSNASLLLSTIESKCKVTLDPKIRKDKIIKDAEEQANKINGRIVWKDDLLNEVQGLTEHPVSIIANFDSKYLEIPREVLLTSMETHQKSFGIEDTNHNLLPYFITVLNLEPKDIDIVKKGWERVLRARLEDANFFWKTDLNTDFDVWLKKLDNVIFIGPLGSIGNKTLRLAELCTFISNIYDKQFNTNLEQYAYKVGRLSKADLVSSMVCEFDTLQGIMGGIYADKKNEPKEISQALKEQYLPSGPDSPLPSTQLGMILSIADKADTLTGCFGLGMIPTGAADPNGLRRAALGIIRILINNNLDISIKNLFTKAIQNYENVKWKTSPEITINNLLEFFKTRLRQYLQQYYNILLVDAALNASFDNLADTKLRLEALQSFSKTKTFPDSVQTFKRLDNIIRKQSENIPDNFDKNLLKEEQEKALVQKLDIILPKLNMHIENKNYNEILSTLTEIQGPLHTFFENVMVMCDDNTIRTNRLAILRTLRNKFSWLADFSALQI